MFKLGKVVLPPVLGADCVVYDPSDQIPDLNYEFGIETAVTDFLREDIAKSTDPTHQHGNAICACFVALNEHGVANNPDHWKQVLEFLISLKVNSWLCAATAPRRSIEASPPQEGAQTPRSEWPDVAVIATTFDDPDKNDQPDVIKALGDIAVPVVCGKQRNAAMKAIINARSNDPKEHHKSILQVLLADDSAPAWDNMRATLSGLEVFASFFAIPQVVEDGEAPTLPSRGVQPSRQSTPPADQSDRYKMPLFVFDGPPDSFASIFGQTQATRIGFLADLIGDEYRFLVALTHEAFQAKSDDDFAQMIKDALNQNKISNHAEHKLPDVVRVAPALAGSLGVTYLEVRPHERDLPRDLMPHSRARQGAR